MRRRAGSIAAVMLGALLLAAGAQAASVDYFLKLEGVDGESQSSGHRIELRSFHSGGGRPGTYASGSAIVTRSPDALTSRLLAARVHGVHFPLVEIGLGPKTICLIDASVAAISDTGGDQPTESISFNFEAGQTAYAEQGGTPSGGRCTPGKDPVVVAFTGDSGGVHARIDCLVPRCVGELSVAGIGKASFTVPGGRAREVRLPTRPIRPGRVVTATIRLKGRSAPIVERSLVPALLPTGGGTLILTCAVAGTEGVTTSITGSAWRAAAGQTVTITYTAPSGRTTLHDATVHADGSFDDTLTPNEAGTWTGIAPRQPLGALLDLGCAKSRLTIRTASCGKPRFPQP